MRLWSRVASKSASFTSYMHAKSHPVSAPLPTSKQDKLSAVVNELKGFGAFCRSTTVRNVGKLATSVSAYTPSAKGEK